MTFEKVAKIISEYKEIAVEEIAMDSTFAKDLGLDSLDTVELIMSLEDEFGVSLEIDENLKSVGDLVAMIDKEKNK